MAIIVHINTLRPKQNGPHFPDDILTCISFIEKIALDLTEVCSQWSN